MSGCDYEDGALDHHKKCSFCGTPTHINLVQYYRFDSSKCKYAKVCDDCWWNLGHVIKTLENYSLSDNGDEKVYVMTAEFAETWRKGKREQIKRIRKDIGYINELEEIDAQKKKKSKTASNLKGKSKGKSKRKAQSDEDEEDREESAPAAKKQATKKTAAKQAAAAASSDGAAAPSDAELEEKLRSDVDDLIHAGVVTKSNVQALDCKTLSRCYRARKKLYLAAAANESSEIALSAMGFIDSMHFANCLDKVDESTIVALSAKQIYNIVQHTRSEGRTDDLDQMAAVFFLEHNDKFHLLFKLLRTRNQREELFDAFSRIVVIEKHHLAKEPLRQHALNYPDDKSIRVCMMDYSSDEDMDDEAPPAAAAAAASAALPPTKFKTQVAHKAGQQHLAEITAAAPSAGLPPARYSAEYEELRRKLETDVDALVERRWTITQSDIDSLDRNQLKDHPECLQKMFFAAANSPSYDDARQGMNAIDSISGHTEASGTWINIPIATGLNERQIKNYIIYETQRKRGKFPDYELSVMATTFFEHSYKNFHLLFKHIRLAKDRDSLISELIRMGTIRRRHVELDKMLLQQHALNYPEDKASVAIFANDFKALAAI
jgi:hypothetical protein